jgi:hypothetical protein
MQVLQSNKGECNVQHYFFTTNKFFKYQVIKQPPQQSILFHVTSTFIFTNYEVCYLLNL